MVTPFKKSTSHPHLGSAEDVASYSLTDAEADPNGSGNYWYCWGSKMVRSTLPLEERLRRNRRSIGNIGDEVFLGAVFVCFFHLEGIL